MPATPELPNPFVMKDGTPLRSASEWPRRRREILDLVVRIEYGGLPPAPVIGNTPRA